MKKQIFASAGFLRTTVLGVFGMATLGSLIVRAQEGGTLPFSFGIETGILFDDNIVLSNADEEDDFVFSIAPSLTFETSDGVNDIQNYLGLTYTPIFSWFADNSEFDSDEHIVDGDYSHQSGGSQFAINANYSDLAGNLTEFADRVDREVVTGRINFNQQLTGKALLEVSTVYTDTDYEDFSDSDELYAQASVRHAFSGKLSLGPGIRYGESTADNGPDQAFIQPYLRTVYEPTGKLVFTGIVGVEVRDFDGAGAADDRETFVFDFYSDYSITETVSLLAQFYRGDQISSSSGGNNFTTTGASAGLQVFVLQTTTATVEAAYEETDFYETLVGSSNGRDDDYFDVKLEVEYLTPDELSLSAFYRYRTNDSNIDAVDFDNNQIGFQVAKEF